MPQLINFKTKDVIRNPVTQKSSTTSIEAIKEYLMRKYNSMIYDISTVAKEIGVSYEFIRKGIAKGAIKGILYGSRRKIHIDEFSRIIAEGV